MKEFKTLEEVKEAIEQWFVDCGYSDNKNIDKQHNKILEEIEELEVEIIAENTNNIKSEAGDVFVTLVGAELKNGRSLNLDFIDDLDSSLMFNIAMLKTEVGRRFYMMAVEYLNDVCLCLELDLLECATIAYNKIEQRRVNGQLKIINGTIQK